MEKINLSKYNSENIQFLYDYKNGIHNLYYTKDKITRVFSSTNENIIILELSYLI